MEVVNKISNSWKGANGFSRFLFVLQMLLIPTTIVGTIVNVVKKPEVDYTKLNWKLNRDIDTWGKKGDIVKVLESDGINFKISHNGYEGNVSINELELV